jgi:hypothetical protein
MRIFTLIALLFVGLQVMAQSYSLTIFNNGGQQFFVIMNGIKQNSLPLTNVKIGSLSQGSYEVKLIFADGKTADINKKIYLEEPGDYLARVTFKKGKGKLQYFGTTGGGTQAPGGSTNVIYRPSEQAVFSDQPVVQTPTAPVTSTPNQGSVGTTTTVTSSQTPNSAATSTTVQGSSTSMSSSTTATTSGNSQTGGINMDVNMTDPSNTGNGGVGTTTTAVDPVTGETIQMNVGISMSGMDPNNSGMNTQTTTTTTSSSSTSTSTITTNVQQNVNISTSGTQTPSTPPAPKQPMSVTCSEMFTSTTYVDELKRMTFDEDRLTSIQSTLKTKCLTSGQAYKVLETLTFSGDRLEMAKFIYMRLTDPFNAMSLSELFTFDSEKEEFETFVKQNKR